MKCDLDPRGFARHVVPLGGTAMWQWTGERMTSLTALAPFTIEIFLVAPPE